jgi:hypothetical protein
MKFTSTKWVVPMFPNSEEPYISVPMPHLVAGDGGWRQSSGGTRTNGYVYCHIPFIRTNEHSFIKLVV